MGSICGSKGFKVPLPKLFPLFYCSHFGFYDSNENVVEMRNQEVRHKLICIFHCVWDCALAWSTPLSLSHPLEVLQEWCVWAEDTGRSWGRDDVHSLRSEARSVALQLHSVHELHGEVAHMNTHVFMQCATEVTQIWWSTHADPEYKLYSITQPVCFFFIHSFYWHEFLYKIKTTESIKLTETYQVKCTAACAAIQSPYEDRGLLNIAVHWSEWI